MEIKMKKSLITISIIFAMVFLPMLESKACLPYPVIDPGKGGGDLSRSKHVTVSIGDLYLNVYVKSSISGNTQTITVTISGNIYYVPHYQSSVMIKPNNEPGHKLIWPSQYYFFTRYSNYFNDYDLYATIDNQEIIITNRGYSGYFYFTFTLIPDGSYIIEECLIHPFISRSSPVTSDWKEVVLVCED